MSPIKAIAAISFSPAFPRATPTSPWASGLPRRAPGSKVGPLVITQDFGSQPNQQAQLVGVAYSDNQHTGMYEIGEGRGGVQIDATNLATGQTTSTQTWSTGGYQIALSPGRYQITTSVNGTVVQTLLMTIGTQNAEQDFVLRVCSKSPMLWSVSVVACTETDPGTSPRSADGASTESC